MIINKNKKIKDLQNEFNTLYPGLKISFYKQKHKNHMGSLASLEYNASLSFNDINPNLTDHQIDLSPNKTVTEVEQSFEEGLGLHAQIFRRSGDIWLQTINTDDWTLKLQNQQGLKSIHA